MTAPLVRVVDHVAYEAAVTPAQALAYCRRVLVGWEEVTREAPPGRPFGIRFTEPAVAPATRQVTVPTYGGAWQGNECAALCSDLVRLGFAAKPSDVLRAMAAEVVT